MIQVRSPRWANNANTFLDVEAIFPWIEELGWVPFSASKDDNTEHGKAIFAAALAGEFGPVADFVPQPYVRRIPAEVTRFQALAALMQAGLLEGIEAYMASDAADAFTKLAWKEAQVFKRPSPLIAAIGALFGLTDAQVDDLFIFAGSIEA